MRRLLALSICLATPAMAQVTNFSTDVTRSIDLGLGWLDANGAYRANSACGNAAGLCALALLEKRESADLRADPIGYANAQPADRARLDRIMGFIINRARNAGFYAYRDGADMMALSVYLRTGGPDVNGARNALNATFDRVRQNQGGHGYWCYSNGSCQDSSTTQLAMAGLAAARGVFVHPQFGDANRANQLNALVARARQAHAHDGRAGGPVAQARGHG